MHAVRNARAVNDTVLRENLIHVVCGIALAPFCDNAPRMVDCNRVFQSRGFLYFSSNAKGTRPSFDLLEKTHDVVVMMSITPKVVHAFESSSTVRDWVVVDR